MACTGIGWLGWMRVKGNVWCVVWGTRGFGGGATGWGLGCKRRSNLEVKVSLGHDESKGTMG